MYQLKSEPVSWDYYDKYKDVDDKYLPPQGEGENMATQIVTAVTKLVYKWYNDGDVFDNTYQLEGWANDLSSYANWLDKYIPEAKPILAGIREAKTRENYENILKDLVDATHNKEYLGEKEKLPIQGSIYDCDGPYIFYHSEDDEYEEDNYEEDEEPGWGGAL